jgi:transposase
MGKPVEVIRMEFSASGLRALAGGTRDGAVAAGDRVAQLGELRTLVLDGPDPERHRVIRWRCADLRDEIAARWSIELHERSVGRLLHRLAMARLQPHPHHPQKDMAAQEAFKKTSPAW